MFWRLFTVQALALAVIVGGGAWLLGVNPKQPGSYALALCAAGTAVIPAWLVSRFYAAPLRRMTRQADLLATGELGARAYVGNAGEVRGLAQALNAMSERLADRFAQLESDRGRLRAVLGGMVEGVVALDAADQIVFANERGGELLDFPASRSQGKKFWEVVRHRPLLDIVESARAAEAPRRAELEWHGTAARSLALYAAPLPGAGLIVVVHDVSDLRRLERIRQEFVANVSHELKTPLAVINACAENLLDGALEDPAYRGPFVEQIRDQGERLHALILDLLRLARVEAHEEAFVAVEVPLESLVEDCLARHRSRAEAKQVRLESAAGAGGAAWADEEACDTILENLVDNAIKYTPAGGTIGVSWGESNDSVWLAVADTGAGIPESDLPRIFERFYRVDKARARELGGTGLGLAIVKHLAQSMGGSVSAVSTVGLGSTFTVRLPAALAASGPAA